MLSKDSYKNLRYNFRIKDCQTENQNKRYCYNKHTLFCLLNVLFQLIIYIQFILILFEIFYLCIHCFLMFYVFVYR